MHIQSYLGEFNSFTSKEQRKMENIFSNLNRSRKSLTKVYDDKNNHDYDDKVNLFKKLSPNKKEEYAFDDNLFHTLYKSNLRVSHQRNNTISGKVDVSKLSFKLNYIENHRPIIKQKIITKAKQKQDSFNINFLTEPKTQLKIETKRSNIEKFIKNTNNPEKGNDFVRSRKTNKISIKDVLQKMNENTVSSGTIINQYQTLPARRIQSSTTHYDLHYQNTKNSPVNRYHTPQRGKQKAIGLDELPDYVKNIMKPCKIKGIELTYRPLSVAMKKKFSNLGSHTMKLREQKPNTQNSELNIEWSVRVVKTARQGGRNKKHINPEPENLRKLKTPQNKDNKNPIIPQPWNIDVNNQQEQQHLFIFNHRTIN